MLICGGEYSYVRETNLHVEAITTYAVTRASNIGDYWRISLNAIERPKLCRWYTSSQKLPQHTHNPQGRKERIFGFRNLLERRTYEELMLGVKGKGRGKRGRVSKKGGSKVDVDEVMELGYGCGASSNVRWTGISRYVPIVPRIPLDWDSKIKAKTDDANLERDEEHLGRFLKQSTMMTKSAAWDGWSKRGTGWTGKSWGGRHVSFPVLPDGRELRQFDSIVIEVRRVANQTSAGKKRSIRAIVVVGNKNGVVGYAVGKSPEIHAAINKAKNKAALQLQYIDRCDGHTIYHNVKQTFCKTTVTMERRTPGHGRRCQRAIAAICELAGIRDIRAKITGPTTPINVVQATFKTLLSQQPHQALANQSGLHVIEMRNEMFNRPIVVASPKNSTPTANNELPEQLNMKLHTSYQPYVSHYRKQLH